MIERKPTETRIEYLARVLYAFMQQNDIAAECVIDYDGVECDGMCLANDFVNELGIDIEGDNYYYKRMLRLNKE